MSDERCRADVGEWLARPAKALMLWCVCEERLEGGWKKIKETTWDAELSEREGGSERVTTGFKS